MHGAGLGDARGALRTGGGEGATMAFLVRLLHAAQRRGRAAGAGAAHRDEAQPFHDARDEFAVKRLRDENRNPEIAKANRAREHSAVPEGEDHRR